MNRTTAIRDILLVVIGLNSLVFPTIMQLGTRMNATLIVVGVVVLLLGIYSTARDFLFRV